MTYSLPEVVALVSEWVHVVGTSGSLGIRQWKAWMHSDPWREAWGEALRAGLLNPAQLERQIYDTVGHDDLAYAVFLKGLVRSLPVDWPMDNVPQRETLWAAIANMWLKQACYCDADATDHVAAVRYLQHQPWAHDTVVEYVGIMQAENTELLVLLVPLHRPGPRTLDMILHCLSKDPGKLRSDSLTRLERIVSAVETVHPGWVAQVRHGVEIGNTLGLDASKAYCSLEHRQLASVVLQLVNQDAGLPVCTSLPEFVLV